MKTHPVLLFNYINRNRKKNLGEVNVIRDCFIREKLLDIILVVHYKNTYP